MRRPDPVHEFRRFNSSSASCWLAHVVPWCTRFRARPRTAPPGSRATCSPENTPDAKISPGRGGLHWGQGDVVAQLLELVEGALLGPVRVAPGVEVAAGLAVEHAIYEHVPDGDEHGVLDRDDRLDRSAS